MEADLKQSTENSVEACKDYLKQLIAETEGWENIKNSQELVAFKRKTDSGIHLIKAIAEMDRSPEEVFNIIWDYERKHEWDEMLLESTLVQEFESDLRVLYNRFHAPWPVSERDFVFASKKYIEDSGSILVVGCSVDAGVPERNKTVRGEILASGFYIEKLSETRCRVTYLVNVDPKGSLPTWLVNKMSGKQCNNLIKIRDFKR